MVKTTISYKNINPLPVLTWNWLHMNRTSLETETNITNLTPDIGPVPEGVTLTKAEASKAEKLPEITGGVGKEADLVMKQFGTVPLFINAAKDTIVSSPVIMHFTLPDQSGSAASQIIRAEEGSSVTVIMDYTSQPDHNGFQAIQTKLFAGKNAHIHLIKVQLLGSQFIQLDDTAAYCEEDGSVDVTQIELGGSQTFAGVSAQLAGTGSSFKSDTAYLCRNKQNLDLNYVVVHTGRNTKSDMHVKGVLNDDARKIYRGTIDFRNGCSGAKGNEQEETLLISPKVINKTIPLILCDEEDVEGTHGATIGRLGADELFYMQSRGINEKAAQKMMSRARIASIAHFIPDQTLIEKVESYVDRAFDYE